MIYDPTGKLKVETVDFGTSGIVGVAIWSVGITRRRDVLVTARELARLMMRELRRRRVLTPDDAQT